MSQRSGDVHSEAGRPCRRQGHNQQTASAHGHTHASRLAGSGVRRASVLAVRAAATRRRQRIGQGSRRVGAVVTQVRSSQRVFALQRTAKGHWRAARRPHRPALRHLEAESTCRCGRWPNALLLTQRACPSALLPRAGARNGHHHHGGAAQVRDTAAQAPALPSDTRLACPLQLLAWARLFGQLLRHARVHARLLHRVRPAAAVRARAALPHGRCAL